MAVLAEDLFLYKIRCLPQACNQEDRAALSLSRKGRIMGRKGQKMGRLVGGRVVGCEKKGIVHQCFPDQGLVKSECYNW